MKDLKEFWEEFYPLVIYLGFAILVLITLAIFSQEDYQGKCVLKHKGQIPGIVYIQDDRGVMIMFKDGDKLYRKLETIEEHYEEVSCLTLK